MIVRYEHFREDDYEVASRCGPVVPHKEDFNDVVVGEVIHYKENTDEFLVLSKTNGRFYYCKPKECVCLSNDELINSKSYHAENIAQTK